MYRFVAFVLWSLTLAPALVLPSHAGECEVGSFLGTVVDENGLPLEGARVIADGHVGGGLTFTDGEGRFHLGGLPPGSYALTAYLEGYSGPPLRTVQLEGALPREVALVLEGRGDAWERRLRLAVVDGWREAHYVAAGESGPCRSSAVLDVHPESRFPPATQVEVELDRCSRDFELYGTTPLMAVATESPHLLVLEQASELSVDRGSRLVKRADGSLALPRYTTLAHNSGLAPDPDGDSLPHELPPIPLETIQGIFDEGSMDWGTIIVTSSRDFSGGPRRSGNDTLQFERPPSQHVELAVVDRVEELRLFEREHVPWELASVPVVGEGGECGRGVVTLSVHDQSSLEPVVDSVDVVFSLTESCELLYFARSPSWSTPYLLVLGGAVDGLWADMDAIHLTRLDDGRLVVADQRFIYQYRLESLQEDYDVASRRPDKVRGVLVETIESLHGGGHIDWLGRRERFKGRSLWELD